MELRNKFVSTLAGLALIVVGACAPQKRIIQKEDLFTHRVEAVKELERQGVNIDENLRCSHATSQRDSEDAVLKKSFSRIGEIIKEETRSGTWGLRYVLTEKGKVYEVGPMKTYSASSPDYEITCTQVYSPRQITLTEMSAEEFRELKNKRKNSPLARSDSVPKVENTDTQLKMGIIAGFYAGTVELNKTRDGCHATGIYDGMSYPRIMERALKDTDLNSDGVVQYEESLKRILDLCK